MINIQSRIGGRPENQDIYGTSQTIWGECVVVCDGMGGQKGGRHAAEMAVSIILEEMSKSTDGNPVERLQEAIGKSNTAIWKESISNSLFKGMGTTVVALLLTPETAICSHVGDSRLYQLRNREIIYRTLDHSLVFEMVKDGLMTEEQARQSQFSNIITRSLGSKQRVEIEINDHLPYQKGDRFLLCTDGIWGVIPENELLEMATLPENVEWVLTQMVEQIDAIGVEKGGMYDNLTAALIEIE